MIYFKRFMLGLLVPLLLMSAYSVGSKGNVIGATTAADNAIPKFNGTTGKLLQDSGLLIDDDDNLFLPGTAKLRIGGLTGPFHGLHLSDNNIFMEGAGEVGHIVKRLANNVGTSGPLGDRTNPIFIDKRIGQAGDGDFEVKTLFQADEESERVIFKWDSKGIFATIGVSGLLGRQNEGYLEDGHVNPWYAINSEGSEHRLEFGPGGASDVDTAITRTGTQSLSLQVGANSTSLQSKLTVYGDALVVQGGVSMVMPELSTPSSPGANTHKLYFKSDGNLYKLNSSGTEAQVGGGSSSAGEDLITTGNEAQILQVTGLDLDSSPNGYKCRYMLNHSGSNSSSNLFFTLNDDTVQTGYATNGSSNSSTFETTTTTGNVRAGYFELIKMTASGGSEYPSIIYRIVGNDADSTGSTYVQEADNITKVAIRSSSMNFGDGSFLRCFTN